MSVEVRWLPCVARDGHRWEAIVARGSRVERTLVWLPALGVPARSYEPFARALASRGVAVVVHEWRGFGSSGLRASRRTDWGYRELLELDVPATRELAAQTFGGPDTLGGHSLGGQLAACSLALSCGDVDSLWLVASGAPYWKAFPRRTAWWLPAAYRLLGLIANVFGVLPGRRIGFGGNEARGVIRDWSRTGLTGRYRAPGVGDMDPLLSRLSPRVRGVLLAHDWLAPRSSLDYLVGKTSAHDVRVARLDASMLGTRADHFAWMKNPDAVVDALLR